MNRKKPTSKKSSSKAQPKAVVPVKPAKNGKAVAVVKRKGKAETEQQRIERERAEMVASVNWQWREFALGLMNRKDAYEAYAAAFEIANVDTDKKAYQVAAACASRLLKNAKFREFWRELLEEQGFNHDMVDSELLLAITDPNTTTKERIRAIHEYNELHGRLVHKHAFTDPDGKRSLFDSGSFTLEVVQQGAGKPKAKKDAGK